MLEQSALSSSSMWAAMNSWFTPSVLFVLLNLVIGTIAFTSTHNRHRHNPTATATATATTFAASPSLLHRLKSVTSRSAEALHHNNAAVPDSDAALSNADHRRAHNLEPESHYFFPDENFETSQTHYVFPQKTAPAQLGLDERDSDGFISAAVGDVSGGLHASRTKSDTRPASGEIPSKLPARMPKSASLKSAFGHFEEDIVEERRPATAREKAHHDGDEEVDAKADDFINRFKEQLKLQRLDSIVRYRDLIGKGNSGRGGQ